MDLNLHIILQKPPANLAYAVQDGSGTSFRTVQTQYSKGEDLHFDLRIEVKGDKDSKPQPDFKGPFVQGPLGGRFIYLNIGTYATNDEPWGGRLKIPLTGITWETIATATAQPKTVLVTTVPGTGKNGKPNCATVKPFDGWKLKF